jgi:hypothetical protein
MQKVVFASDQLPAELDERTRFTLWRNLCEEHFNSADLDFLTNGAFSVRVEFAQFGGVGLGQLAGTMRRIARSSRHIDADPSDMLCLALNRGRSAYACFQRDQEVTLDAGTATLITNWETIEVRANADTACSTGYSTSSPMRRILSPNHSTLRAQHCGICGNTSTSYRDRAISGKIRR